MAKVARSHTISNAKGKVDDEKHLHIHVELPMLVKFLKRPHFPQKMFTASQTGKCQKPLVK